MYEKYRGKAEFIPLKNAVFFNYLVLGVNSF